MNILVAFQFVLLLCLVRANIQTNNFYVMKANDAISAQIQPVRLTINPASFQNLRIDINPAGIQSYRIGVTRSAMNGVAMCSMESQCRGVWVEPIEARKVRCHFVNSSLSQTEPRKYDFWYKVSEIF